MREADLSRLFLSLILCLGLDSSPSAAEEITIRGLEKPVEIIRDRWGVPRIYAETQHDRFFAQGWVTARGYNQRNVSESLKNFLKERAYSLTWLQEPASPDWQATHHHPRMGPMSAELLLANWLAHDLFHIRQATDLHFAYLSRQAAPISLQYSGWE